jgi:predicted metalloprotease
MRSLSPRRFARLALVACAVTLCLAPAASAAPAFRVPHEPADMNDYLSMVIQDVDAYWTQVYAAADIGQPQVRFMWTAPGQSVPTGCTAGTDDETAYYCPKDDTIYLSQTFAGQQSQKRGDFGLAVVIAHEYAHNVQRELGVYRLRRSSSMPFELMADCMAGMWANWESQRGTLEAGDVEEAALEFYSLGDYAYGDRDHHGTPRQRKRAFLRGYTKGGCQRLLRTRR